MQNWKDEDDQGDEKEPFEEVRVNHMPASLCMFFVDIVIMVHTREQRIWINLGLN